MRPGGDLYPTLIRKNPINRCASSSRTARTTLTNDHGNWFLANQQMLAAIKYANAKADKDNLPGPRYDVKNEWGHGTHNPNHGGAILPDSLRWLWRDYKAKS
jgi:enterochelin esterase family protein